MRLHEARITLGLSSLTELSSFNKDPDHFINSRRKLSCDPIYYSRRLDAHDIEEVADEAIETKETEEAGKETARQLARALSYAGYCCPNNGLCIDRANMGSTAAPMLREIATRALKPLFPMMLVASSAIATAFRGDHKLSRAAHHRRILEAGVSFVVPLFMAVPSPIRAAFWPCGECGRHLEGNFAASPFDVRCRRGQAHDAFVDRPLKPDAAISDCLSQQ